MKTNLLLLLVLCIMNCIAYGQNNSHAETARSNTMANTTFIPLAGNTWKSVQEDRTGRITGDGIENWTNGSASFTVYIRTRTTGHIRIWLKAALENGKSALGVSFQGKTRQISLSAGSKPDLYAYAGEWLVTDTGYQAITITGISKTGEVYADISGLWLSGSVINEKTTFVKNNDGNFFYWGRRGPSVHMGYEVAADQEVEWFYNEITVPEGNDVIGSYFMANGFGEGYFGIQVNGPHERRVLFSVWSPFQTDDPKLIPPDQQIQLIKKGKDVYTGEFGNEGSGGQSYWRFPWKASTTYRFLLRGKPDGPVHTVYTAYFYAPEIKTWKLIASFRRPKVSTYLKRLHSFLENFSPHQGNLERKVLFTNQWIRNAKGEWMELNKARFTGDNTAVKRYRMDFGGGTTGDCFWLRNGGFFSDYTPLNSMFERSLSGKKPKIDFEKLP